MKLVYLWISKYKDLIIRQGFQITKDLIINIDSQYYHGHKPELDITIKDNLEYRKSTGLYGNKVLDVTAIVGENGAGKTTVATMLMDCIPSNMMIPSFGDDKNKSSIYIYYDEADDSKPIKILIYDVNVNINYDSMEKIQIQKNKSNRGLLYQIYTSNVFNVSELRENYYRRDLNSDGIQLQQMYTPAMILKDCGKKHQQFYGYRTNDNQYLIPIQTYAQKMEQSDISCFVKEQEELFLNCYLNAPKDIKNKLPIFKEYILEVEEFEGYLGSISKYIDNSNHKFNEKINELDVQEQSIIRARRVFLGLRENVLKSKNKSIWMQVYILMLSEVYLAFYSIEESIMLNIEEIAYNDEPLMNIDDKILEKIKSFINNDSRLNKTPWCMQIIECIKQIEEYYLNNEKIWTVGKRKFDWEKYSGEESGLIEWYVKELNKKNSFFKRNLRFKQLPTSSGELALVNLFSYINEAISKINIHNDILLIIDEIDAYLHPRWQQIILNSILQWLNQYEHYRFQIVVTSHSPIILSDFIKDHVIKIEKKEYKNENNEIKNKCIPNEQEKETFGASIPMLFYDSFFMSEGNIGEFAKEKISEVINKVSNDNQISEYSFYDSISIEQVEYIINNIGEEVVRRKLLNDYKRKYNKDFDFMEQMKRLDEKEKQKIIEYINQMRKDGEKADD